MKTTFQKEMGCIEKARVTFLAEDLAGYDSPLNARFGLSMLLELQVGDQEKKVLYDTNQGSELILQNLEALGISLERLNYIFLSHCHFDHTGGLAGVLEALNRPIPIISHPGLFRPCFEIKPEGLWPIGLNGYNQADLEKRKAMFLFTRSPLQLMPGVITSGEIPLTNDFEQPAKIFTIEDGIVKPDAMKDDAALILNTPVGLVVLLGCCHAGVVNTLTYARKITGVEHVHAIIGGLHLLFASDERIQKTIEALKEVDIVYAGHCTGLRAVVALMLAKGSNFHQIHTGLCLQVPVVKH